MIFLKRSLFLFNGKVINQQRKNQQRKMKILKIKDEINSEALFFIRKILLINSRQNSIGLIRGLRIRV